MVVPECGGEDGEKIAEERGNEADDGNGTGRGGVPCEQSKGEEAEQRTIGVGGDGIDGIDDAGPVHQAEGEDNEEHNHTHGNMYATTQTFISRAVEEINTGAGGQCGECAVCTREGC